MADDTVDAHEQTFTHSYEVHYPDHEPREDDPHYHDFREYKRRRRDNGTYRCDFAHEYRDGDTSECDTEHPLECHHSHIEFAMTNAVDLALLEDDYPGVSKNTIGEWIDTAPNLELLCRRHHRGHTGKHCATAADFEATKYIRGLIS